MDRPRSQARKATIALPPQGSLQPALQPSLQSPLRSSLQSPIRQDRAAPESLRPGAWQERPGWDALPTAEGDAAQAAVRRILEALGEDPDREGLLDTPARYVKALRELTQGARQDPAEILGRVFTEPYDGPVEVHGIPFWSLCEHHLLPFHGEVDVTYLPDGHVVGLSKIPRLVACFARRLQMQERMTREIADALEVHLAPRGVRVVVRGQHSCMAARGVQAPATMETRVERGRLVTPRM